VPGYFDLWTILFSFVIASLAGFVAFESIDHMRYSKKPAVWTFVGGVTLGMGIWSMHFIGMMAWHPPYPLYYSLDDTLLSVLAAVAASWLAMRITVSHKGGAIHRNVLAGAFLVGTGICAMHYLGMHAMHFSHPLMWSLPGVLLSYLIAILASLGAMALLQQSGNEDFGIGRQIAASGIIGFAICGMHFTGMLAMMVPPGTVCLQGRYSFSGVTLANVGVGNALIFTIALLVVFYREKVNLLRAANDARFQAQESARSAERLGAAGKIAASISHEINNPLEAVTNLLFLIDQGSIGVTEREYLRQAQEELRRIAEITTHTLKFYRQQSVPAETSLPDLFDSAIAIFSNRLSDRKIIITKAWDPKAPRVLCRAGEIRQIFANLISNALDAMPEGGSLRLSVHQAANGGADIEVTDTGEGISEDVQRRIMEPFFTTKGVGGTGLGLSICAEIMQRHGGTLRFTSSTEPGRSGTSFRLYLPTLMKDQPPPPAAMTL
jgi:signal transduction histidine kinase